MPYVDESNAGGRAMSGAADSDLPRLARALEYGDMAAALYLTGGSDHAALLLATASERLLGELFRLNGSRSLGSSVVELLQGLMLMRSEPELDAELRSHVQARRSQPALARVGELAGLADSKARHDTAGLLRAAWFLLESLGLESVAPRRMYQAVERSTIHAHEPG